MDMLICGILSSKTGKNAVLVDYIAEGFCEARPDWNIATSSLVACSHHILKGKPKIVLLIGSLAPDEISFYPIRKAADKTNALLVFWLHDDPFEIDYSPKAAIGDYVFNGDRWSADHFAHPRSRFLPFAAAPKHHLRPWMPYSERSTEVTYTGVGFENRRAILRMLGASLPNGTLQVFGEGWPDDMNFAVNRRITRAQLSDITASSKITLYIQRKLNIANTRWNLDPTGAATRLFETAMAGSLQAIFGDSLEPGEFFDIGSEIVLFDNGRDLQELLEQIRDDPQSVEMKVKRAQDRALKEHTYVHRAHALLAAIDVQ